LQVQVDTAVLPTYRRVFPSRLALNFMVHVAPGSPVMLEQLLPV